MAIRTITLILICLLYCPYLFAQDFVKAYASANDYKAGKSDTVYRVRIRYPKYHDTTHEYPYYVDGTNGKTTAAIQKYWAIEHNDSLFINCPVMFKLKKGYKPSGRSGIGRPQFISGEFVHAPFHSPKYLCFRAGRSAVRGIPRHYKYNNAADAAAMVGGLPAAVIARAMEGDMNKLPELFPYLYDFNLGEVIYFNRGVMRSYVRDAIIPEDADFVSYVNELIKKEP